MAADEPRGRGDAALWWVDLARGVNEYVKGVATMDSATRMSAREALWEALRRWEGAAGHPLAAALMADHVAGLKLFADAAARRDKRSMDVALGFLISNVDEQVRLHAADTVRFPADKWRDLMARHVALTCSYIESLLAGDMTAYEESYGKALKNRDAMAALWRDATAPRRAAGGERGRASSGVVPGP